MYNHHGMSLDNVSMYTVHKEPNNWHCRIQMCPFKLKTLFSLENHMKSTHALDADCQYMFSVTGPSIAEVRLRRPETFGTDDAIRAVTNNTVDGLKLMESRLKKLAPKEKVSHSDCLLFHSYTTNTPHVL